MYQLYFNGQIHTLDADRSAVSALLVYQGRIIYSGRAEDINLPDSAISRFDLRGQHIYPGFTDSHTHIAAMAIDKERIRLDDCISRQSALEHIRKFVSSAEPGAWILGGGWNANQWQDGYPDCKVLDKITSGHPAALFNKDMHTMWLNSIALEKCGFSEGSADPAGGKLGRDHKGNLNGLVYEKVCETVLAQTGEISYDQFKRCMNRTWPDLYALGIVGVHSCEDLQTWSFFQRLHRENNLGLRICMHPPMENTEQFIAAGLRSGYGDEWLRLGGLKYFVDGSLGSQTAEMFAPFEGLDQTGVAVLNEAELSERLAYSFANGFSATIHAIGDKANHKTLNALEKNKSISDSFGLRNRIEHAQIINDTDIPRFHSLGVTASMQPMHLADDVKIADKYLGKRNRLCYRFGDLLNSGAKMIFGSDMPITTADPIKGIQAAVGRRYNLDKNEAVWFADQVISAQSALHAYTVNAAYSSYEEQVKGTLTPGKVADFIAVAQPFENADESVLSDLRVDLTVLNGTVVYQRDA
ncbi:MAG: amidohydrolase [Calditrichales bacterium]|nr:MAG: amidohydrolase [Calditrichales bacterium]